MDNTIVLSRENHLAILTINRPEKLNTFTQEMCVRFEKLCQEIDTDQSIRAVLLRGNGEVFTGGADIHELNKEMSSITAEALSIIRQFNSCILLLREMNKLVITAAHGLVTGLGMSLLLASDLVIASENTRFSLGYNQIGLSPMGACSYFLPRIVGSKKAMELLTLSEVFTAKQAQDYGLVNWVVPHQELTEKTQHIVERIVNGPTIAINQTKQLLNSAWQNRLTSQLELEAEALVKCINTKDFKMAVNSFTNKHIPEFSGK